MDAGRRLIQSPLFWCLALCFITMAINHGVIINHLLPILDARGVQKETAILAISMIGPMQVAGRLAMMAAERHVTTSVIFMVCTIAAAIASLSLYWRRGRSRPSWSALCCFRGAGHGVVSIVRPVIIADYLGLKDFGLVSGVLASIFLVGFAFAPTIGSLIWVWGGYDRVIEFTFAIALTSFAALFIARLIAGR